MSIRNPLTSRPGRILAPPEKMKPSTARRASIAWRVAHLVGKKYTHAELKHFARCYDIPVGRYKQTTVENIVRAYESGAPPLRIDIYLA